MVLAASGAAFAQTPVDEWARDAVARALEANAQIKDDAHRVQSLAEIAQAQIAIGDTAAASDTLDTARELADQVREEPLASWVMHDIAMARLKTTFMWRRK